MDCRHDAGKDPAGTTWQCSSHVLAERDWLRAKLANVMVEWEHDVEVLTKERNAALTLSEQREAAYDMMRREFEELLGCGDTMGEEAFERGLARLRGLLAAESRAARLEAALRASVVAMKRWSAEEDGLPVAPIGAHEAVAAAESIVGYVWAGWGPDPTRAARGGE
jgi:hypothetical protein